MMSYLKLAYKKCRCGCNREITNLKNEYILGHNGAMKGKKHSKETKRKIGLANKGNMHSEKAKKKMSLALSLAIQNMSEEDRKKRFRNLDRLGKSHSEESKLKMSISHIGSKQTKETIEKRSLSLIGKKRSEETKRKISLIHRGRKCSKETRKRMALSQRGNTNAKGHTLNHSEKTKEKIGRTSKEHWKNPDYQKKQQKVRAIRPNKAENVLLILLENLYPGEWKYTGDFSFMINGKCPDFININGHKKIIELYGDYWHKGDNPQDRIDEFSLFGYETLIVWENQLKNETLLKRRLTTFCRKEK